MTSNIKTAVAATAVAPSAMSVRSAELGALKPAPVLFAPDLAIPANPADRKGRSLSSAYAGTDVRVIAVDSTVLRRGEGIGLACNAELGWQGRERTSVITRDERPASIVTACEQQQVEDMAQAMGTTGFAGMHGYPSWRART
ncbi:MAG: hypothetical protein HOV68_22210 [Streptomycetaceae bacterium]|nr:hypothetical protein [Streptomycetaceae bacterium]